MSTPEGWYADPDSPGMVRWWDGAAWADMQIPEALAPKPLSAGAKVWLVSTTLSKLWLQLLLIGAVAVLVFVVLVILVS